MHPLARPTWLQAHSVLPHGTISRRWEQVAGRVIALSACSLPPSVPGDLLLLCQVGQSAWPDMGESCHSTGTLPQQTRHTCLALSPSVDPSICHAPKSQASLLVQLDLCLLMWQGQRVANERAVHPSHEVTGRALGTRLCSASLTRRISWPVRSSLSLLRMPVAPWSKGCPVFAVQMV